MDFLKQLKVMKYKVGDKYMYMNKLLLWLFKAVKVTEAISLADEN